MRLINLVRAGLPVAWLLAAGQVFGQTSPPCKVSVKLASGEIREEQLADQPLRFTTMAGDLRLYAHELTEIVFMNAERGTLATIYGDSWNVEAKPQLLQNLFLNPKMRRRVNSVESVKFTSSAEVKASVSGLWVLEFQDGSRVHVFPAMAPITLRTEWMDCVLNMQLLDYLEPVGTNKDLRLRLGIGPGDYTLEGRPTGAALAAADQGGRKIRAPWEILVRAAPAPGKARAGGKVRSKHTVTCRYPDGRELQMTAPVGVLTLNGRAGTWNLPTPRILRVMSNPDGSHSVQTLTGEWLTGTLKPKAMPRLGTPLEPDIPWSSLTSATWDNQPVKTPDGCMVWRLRSGDLLVGSTPTNAWTFDLELGEPVSISPSSIGAVERDANGLWMVSAPGARRGSWPAPRFPFVRWSDGEAQNLAWADIECGRAGAAADMPPAAEAGGWSATWSDEVYVQGGSFLLGRLVGEGLSDEIPPAEIALESFYLGACEVTRAQFAAYVENTDYVTDEERASKPVTWRVPGFPQQSDEPVVCVTWRDAVRYCNWRSSRAGLDPCYDMARDGDQVTFLPERTGYRLPLEAEWEYAARSGGLKKIYSWGDENREDKVAQKANFRLTESTLDPWLWTSPVKAFPPSALGLYDMGGNVWEWCQDLYLERAYQALRNAVGRPFIHADLIGETPLRVMRGGSYYNSLDQLRCAARGYGAERAGAPRVGFRMARNVPATPAPKKFLRF